MKGLLLAVGWLTVVPVPSRGADVPAAAAGALRWAPAVGAVLGAAAGGLAVGLRFLGLPALVAAFLVVGFLAMATRGMHVDGLADTADGLGCYGPPARALAVMRDGGAGPFAVVTLVVVLGAQAAALAAIPSGAAVVVATALAAAVGRAGFAWCARRGVSAARPGGLGALVAGTQPSWVAPLWWLALCAAAALALPDRAVAVAVAVALAAGLVVALSRHTSRRFGGVTGDVLGAASELGTTAVLVVMASGAAFRA